ncbi:MAG: alpha/beta fold hydrolase [Desulfobulbaceae bacterium]|nr:alpha/beta fold hydrolase [Desulfobulbaceae bacterium]
MPAEYPFSPETISVAGQYSLSYVDAGEGQPVVFLHGNPSWSYLYRNLIAGLSSSCRCIAPDHLGCGYSDKPQHYSYLLRNHIANLESLLDHLHIEQCTLVMHDWGGAIGMGWAVRNPGRVKKLVVMNTAAFRSDRIPLRITVCGWPLIGPLLVRGLNVFARAAVHMAVTGRLDPEVAAGFLDPYDSWANRIAILRFVRDIPLHPDHPSWNDLVAIEQGLHQLTDKPMLVCWGGRDFCFTSHFFAEWQRRFPGADCHYFAEAGHYLLEDAFAEIFPLIRQFIDSEERGMK